jgi:hypothetical protein
MEFADLVQPAAEPSEYSYSKAWWKTFDANRISGWYGRCTSNRQLHTPTTHTVTGQGAQQQQHHRIAQHHQQASSPSKLACCCFRVYAGKDAGLKHQLVCQGNALQ